ATRARSVGVISGSGPGCSRRHVFTQLPRVPALICRSRATSATGLSVSSTICTASALNWELNFRRELAIELILSDRENLSNILDTPHIVHGTLIFSVFV